MKPYGLARLIVTVCLAIAVLCIGVWGCGGIGGFAAEIASRMRNRIIVFAAAPVKVRRKFLEIATLLKLKAPPPYVNETLLKTQSVQSTPSNCCTRPDHVALEKWRLAGGTVGTSADTSTPPGPPRTCANVDVWLPESMRNITEAPTINDPNASIILDIKPPLEGERGDCAVWVYHYGNPPEKFRPSAPQLEVVGGGRASAGSQSPMPSIPEAP